MNTERALKHMKAALIACEGRKDPRAPPGHRMTTKRLSMLWPALLLIWWGASFAGPGDMVSTSSAVIKEVHIQNTSTAAVYYFVTEGGWQTANCSGVQQPYIAEDAPGAKAIIAAALASKLSGSPLAFAGICGDSGGNTYYLQIRYTVF